MSICRLKSGPQIEVLIFMKTLAAVIAVILFASSLSQAQWKKDGKPVEDNLIENRSALLVGTF